MLGASEDIDAMAMSQNLEPFQDVQRASEALRNCELPSTHGLGDDLVAVADIVTRKKLELRTVAESASNHIQDTILKVLGDQLSDAHDKLKIHAQGGALELETWKGTLTDEQINKMSWNKFCDYAKTSLRAPYILELQEQYNAVEERRAELTTKSNQFGHPVPENLDAKVGKTVMAAVSTFVTACVYATLSSSRAMPVKRQQTTEALKDLDRFGLTEEAVLPNCVRVQLDKCRTAL